MPTVTQNYGIKKPIKGEKYNLVTINENADIIDESIKEVDDRISNIIAQSGTSSTEVVDARGGFTVLSERLSEINAQLAETEQEIMSFKEEYTNLKDTLSVNVISTNLFDISTSTTDGYINPTTGNLGGSQASGYITTDFIPVTEGKVLRYTAFYNSVRRYFSYRFVAAYDSNKVVMPSSGSSTETQVWTIPSGVSYIRVSWNPRADFNVDVMLYLADLESSPIPSYEAYFAPYLKVVAPVVVDDTLTQEGIPADAKAIGDAITNIANRKPIGFTQHFDSVLANESKEMSSFPQRLELGQRLSFSAKFTSWGDTDNIIYGFINTAQTDRQGFFLLTKTNVQWQSAGYTFADVAHGLVLTDYVHVSVTIDEVTSRITVVLNTNNNTFTWTQTSDSTRCVSAGFLTIKPTMALTDVNCGASCSTFKSPVWMIGDSYFSNGSDRVIGNLKDWGYTKGVLVAGKSGMNSAEGYAELLRLLEFGTPKILVWYLGMNDTQAIVNQYYPLVEQICDENNIELIMNKIPVVPSYISDTTYVDNYVINSGRRYIDSYSAVGADPNGNWYTGYLHADLVHPTNTGAMALASRLLVDAPEILACS